LAPNTAPRRKALDSLSPLVSGLDVGSLFFAEGDRSGIPHLRGLLWMLSLLLCLRFGCTGCGDPIEATLQCEGQGVADNVGAAARIACPCCGTKNQVIFTPDGTI